MKFQGKIYIHKNKINNHCYVGQTTQKPEWRWGKNGVKYLYKNEKDEYKQPKIAQAILKYGWDSFEHIILPTIYKNQEELDQAEIEMIKELDSYHNGYNATEGGDHKIPPKYGKDNHMTRPEYRALFSKMFKGRKFTEEHKENIRKAKSNISDETRSKMSESAKKRVEKYGTKWRYIPDEAGKENLRKIRSKRIILYNDEEQLIFESRKKAAEHLNCSPTALSHVMKGIRETIKGYKVRYHE